MTSAEAVDKLNKQLKESQAIIAAERDKMRAGIEETQDFLNELEIADEELDGAAHHLQSAVDDINSAMDTISQTI